MIIISIITIIKTYEKKIISEKGIEVVAEVITAPNTCDNYRRRPPYSKIKFNNKIFIKKIEKDYCHWVSQKKTVKMLTNEKKNTLIFVNEYDPNQFVFGVLLMIIGIVISVKKLYDMRKSK
ncbi:hypothetical protein GCM10022259_15430 [Aquimarina mytili]